MRIITIVKASIAISMIALGLVAASWVAGASAQQPPSPPGQGPCSHGNTGKECRADPSENGKDCDLHGKNGGVNEDHCVSATEPIVSTDNVKTTTNVATTEITTTTKVNASTSTTVPVTRLPVTSGVLGTTTAIQTPVPVNNIPGKKSLVGKHAEQSGVLGSDATVSSGPLAFTP
jgi:hypothetical protein